MQSINENYLNNNHKHNQWQNLVIQESTLERKNSSWIAFKIIIYKESNSFGAILILIPYLLNKCHGAL